jgi:hypothetical protein
MIQTCRAAPDWDGRGRPPYVAVLIGTHFDSPPQQLLVFIPFLLDLLKTRLLVRSSRVFSFLVENQQVRIHSKIIGIKRISALQFGARVVIPLKLAVYLPSLSQCIDETRVRRYGQLQFPLGLRQIVLQLGNAAEKIMHTGGGLWNSFDGPQVFRGGFIVC